MIVVDASAFVDALVGEGRAVDRLTGEELAAPHLVDAEVGNALRKKVLAGDLSPALGEAAIHDLAALEFLRWEHVELLPRAWELRQNVTIYDGIYVALAELLDAPLVTLDARLAGLRGARATVEVIGAD